MNILKCVVFDWHIIYSLNSVGTKSAKSFKNDGFNLRDKINICFEIITD